MGRLCMLDVGFVANCEEGMAQVGGGSVIEVMVDGDAKNVIEETN